MFSFKKLPIFTLLTALLLSFTVSETYSQKKENSEQPETHKLEGKVINVSSGEGLSNAEVHIVGKQIKAETDKKGMFTFKKLPVGAHTVKVDEEGFKKLKEKIKLNKDTRIVIQLKPKGE